VGFLAPRGSMKKIFQNIVLVGFMGVGKSTIGELLSKQTCFRFVDIDREIEKRENRSISEIFHRNGESGFRKIEKEVISEISQNKERFVIASGGGVLLDPENERNLKNKGILICLTASPEEIIKRVQKGENRPLLKNKENRLQAIENLLSRRDAIYRRADLTVRTDHKTPHQIVSEIRDKLDLNAETYQERIPVSLGGGRGYPILLGNGNLYQIGGYLAENFRNRIAVISNSLVWKLHGLVLKRSLIRAGFKPLVILIPDGERYKTLKWANYAIGELLKSRFERSSPILAFGGGVIGDLAGFVSGIFLRGTPLIQVPTTLISQVDSSIGGKTGVNDPLGKNLIGIFHQPKVVWIDTSLLHTLKKRDYISGLGEVIKYGMIADLELFEFLEENREQVLKRELAPVFHMIKRSCEIKADVVSQDEKESGLRKILNYGHTMGHAVEAVTRYKKYRHGEAVGIGMHFAASLGLRVKECSGDLVERQRKLIESFHLPFKIPGLTGSDLIKSMALDKKVTEGRIYFILPSKIGKVVIKPVEKKPIQEEIRKLIAES
jgi:shikimate kinase/3-dehydroquinate synthase